MAFPPVPFQEWFLRQTSAGNAALNAYVARVKADGGVVEAIGCVPLAVWDWTAPVAPTLLLDLYPNAAAAYSLRKLRAAYSGSAVRVRKEVSSVSSETDIGFLADGSLDTVSLLAFASDADSGDVFVVRWYDQSTNGNNATQGTAAAQPKIVSSGAVITEGTSAKPAVDFDGVNDYFGFTSLALDDMLISSVQKIDTGSSAIYNGASDYFRSRIGSYRARINSANIDFLGATFQQQTLLSFQRVGSALELFEDGASLGSDSNSSTFNIYEIGGNAVSFLFQGNLQEFVFYPSDQSANRTSIESNQATFYGITL